ncbi:N-methyl-L-tryptophan oxidase [Stigmatella sp. ncwal1]|uniref:N-methyl-L-tryptophan oxidase n=1 Tax=Stigmatella ashevillensis TaxID=2995309 RepID=A0ABT5D6X4_9BACT|nr:N-methyl-L-tryptophan oxidase [Stigmatella ashevillena]MDC0708603.1 N-methyl-L-tryptophan oxidase [Stigmatella ashevillena]
MARIAVLGAGGVGSAAARFLAREGHAVTVVEQFTPDHDRGSSYGTSRIIRKTYTDGLYTALMGAAYPLWDALEREAGETLFLRTGGLFFGPSEHSEMAAIRKALGDNGVAFEELDPAACARRFPEFRLLPGESAVFEPEAGFLRASACVRANLRLAEAHGARVRAGARVVSIEPRADAVALVLEGGEVLGFDRLVVSAGPWTARLLAPFVPLPLTVTRQVYCHFEPVAPLEGFGVGRFPVWIDFATNFYGFPHDGEAPGVKVAWHEPGSPTEPERVDRNIHEADREPLRQACAAHLPGLSPRVVLEKVCLYTLSPDHDFVVASLPGEPRVTVLGGLSGHGFKFTVLLGRIAAWMATDQPVPWDVSRWSLARLA